MCKQFEDDIPGSLLKENLESFENLRMNGKISMISNSVRPEPSRRTLKGIFSNILVLLQLKFARQIKAARLVIPVKTGIH